jgi:hypothetical protein
MIKYAYHSEVRGLDASQRGGELLFLVSGGRLVQTSQREENYFSGVHLVSVLVSGGRWV